MGSTKSHGWFVRLTTPLSELIPEMFFSGTSTTAAVFETGKEGANPHWHVLYIFPEARTRNSIVKVLNELGFKGNAMMSIKQWDGNDRVVQYMYKEGEPRFTGTRPVDWKTCAQYKVMAEAEATAFKRVRDKETKERYPRILEYVKQYADSETDLSEVIPIYLKGLKEITINYRPNKFKMSQDLTNIMLDLDNKVYKQRLNQWLFDHC